MQWLLVASLLLQSAVSAAPLNRSNKIYVTVYAALPPPESAAVARKQRFDLEHLDEGLLDVSVTYLTQDEQLLFLQERSEPCSSGSVTAAAVVDAMSGSSTLRAELFKWCALATAPADTTSLWLDSGSPILNSGALQSTLLSHDNVAVFDGANIHGSYFQMRTTEPSKMLALRMLQLLMQTDIAVLESHALLVPRTLHDLIVSMESTDWYSLQLSCRKGTAQQQQESRNHLACPTGYCCSIQDATAGTTVMMSRLYIIPYQSIPEYDQLKAPYAGGGAENVAERPYISTITVKRLLPDEAMTETPNFYEMLAAENCLPDHDRCSRCLREKKGATCESCASSCACYCEKLCRVEIPPKRLVQEWTVTPPLYAKDPTRLIPRIVHQTWYEELGANSYPNMSRLVESFKQSGWDYRFYTDADAIVFLQTHFPPVVMEAYEALIPGAFKADLFRYCVLLIFGGVYADVDIQLESALDVSIPPDVGFMVPIDEVRPF